MSLRNWGASVQECAARYPCDELAFAHDEAFFRAIDIAAPPQVVFAWVSQLRIAPYSYDWLDNFGRRSPARLTAGAERLAVGQRIMHVFRVLAFEPGATLTIGLATRFARAVMGDFAGSYAVRATPTGTRLIAKVLVRYPAGVYGAVLRRAIPAVDLIMFRKQLFTLRAYAERDARARCVDLALPG